MKRNPKLEGSNLFDCIPQKGPCPNNCNQCYYNHHFYLPIDQSHFPTSEEVSNGIVRVNSGHDSNIERNYVISSTDQYSKRFFNTSIPNLDFPDPVVLTINPDEEKYYYPPSGIIDLYKLMFIRIRVSSTNLSLVIQAIKAWESANVPIILTFMRYYDKEVFNKQYSECYEYRKSHLNFYWCPTSRFMKLIYSLMKLFNNYIYVCSGLCRDCGNCEYFYYQTKRKMNAYTTT